MRLIMAGVGTQLRSSLQSMNAPAYTTQSLASHRGPKSKLTTYGLNPYRPAYRWMAGWSLELSSQRERKAGTGSLFAASLRNKILHSTLQCAAHVQDYIRPLTGSSVPFPPENKDLDSGLNLLFFCPFPEFSVGEQVVRATCKLKAKSCISQLACRA